MKYQKRIICFIIILSLLLGITINAFAQAELPPNNTQNNQQQALPQTNPFDIEAKAAFVIETNSRQVLYKKNENEKMAPASITKIMTLLLVMEALDSKKIKLDDTVTVSEHASKMGGSQIWLKQGEKMSVNDLLKAAAIASANDASVALAELVGGTEQGFVNMMNIKAKELDMKDTTFKNASGLDADGHLTTAHDIGIMSMELLKHKKITDYTSVWMDSLRGGQTSLVNTNNLVRFYDGCTGLKTGTTDKAGSCLSASAKKGDMEVVSVTMGSANTASRQKTARSLLDYSFSSYELAGNKMDNNILAPIKVVGGQGYYADVYTDLDEKILVQKGKAKDIKKTVEISNEVKAPVEKNQTVGKVIFTLDGKKIKEYPIKTKEKTEKINFLYSYYLLVKNILKL